METTYIHNLTLGKTACVFAVATAPAGDPAAQSLPSVQFTRAELQGRLRVGSFCNPQRITSNEVLLHQDIYAAVTDWLNENENRSLLS